MISPLSQIKRYAEGDSVEAPIANENIPSSVIQTNEPVAESSPVNQLRSERISLDNQIKKLQEGLSTRKNQMFDPTWLSIAQGLLAPTKTGGFGESAGIAAGNVAEQQAKQKAQEQADLESQFKVAQMQYGIHKENVTDDLKRDFLANYGKPNDKRTVTITLPDGTEGTKEEPFFNPILSIKQGVQSGVISPEKLLELQMKQEKQGVMLTDAEAKAMGLDTTKGQKWNKTATGTYEIVSGTKPTEPNFEQQMWNEAKSNGFTGSYIEWKNQLSPFQKMEIEKWKTDRADKEAGKFDDSTIDMLAEQALAGDKSVFTGLGRGTQGANNIASIRTRMNQKMKDKGWSGKDIAAVNAEFNGIVAGERTAAVKGANIELAGNEFLNIVPLALKASEAVPRSGLLPFGNVQMMFDENVNDPNFKAFAAYNNGIVNTYARAISPTGIPNVDDKKHARELLALAQDKTAYKSTINALAQEIEAAKKSPAQVRESLHQSITGNSTSSSAPSQVHTLHGREIVPNKKNDGWVYKDDGKEAK
jgi:hypothetical protein